VKNGSIEIPNQIRPGKQLIVKGQFEVVCSAKDPRFVIQVKIVQVLPSGNAVTIVSENVRNVEKIGSRWTCEIEMQVLGKAGSYEVRACAASTLAGETRLLVIR
jgi:hypothetical protein